MTVDQIIALASGVVAALSAMYAFRIQRRKVDSDVWEKAMVAMDKAMANLRIDNDFLRSQDEKNRKTIDELKAGYDTLQQTLNTALDRIRVLEHEKAKLMKANTDLARKLSAGIDSLIERRPFH